MGRDRLRVVVCGMVGLYPVGGVAFDYLQYVIGLARLGHEVVYHEDTWTWPYDPVARSRTDSPAYTGRFLERFFRRFVGDLPARWHYQHLHDDHLGMSRAEFDGFCASADVLLNVSGASPLPPALSNDCRTVFIDTDPGYNQIVLLERPEWADNVDRWAELFDAHDSYATYGENLARGGSRIPDLGKPWVPTRVPIVRDLWTGRPSRPGDPWTTVMTWNAFSGPLILSGVEYGSKDVEIERIAALPSQTDAPLEVALGGIEAPSARLERLGWDVVDAPSATLSPDDYQSYIARSRGELSIAKNVYVELRSGWFSCRSACYLSAGRPVIVQDTGFSDFLETGAGLIAFDDLEGARVALADVEADYDRHRVAALEIARSQFDAPTVLDDLLSRI